MYCGVDFSGAKDAGKKIWIATLLQGGNQLRLESLRQAKDLPGGSSQRYSALSALVASISHAQPGSVVGMDFPFSLPLRLLGTETWEDFITTLGQRYDSPVGFRRLLRQRANKPELRRETDKKARTPFSPYNLRLYKQTFFGIQDVLLPLIQSNSARILPMQQPAESVPSVVEVCPASTLKDKKAELYKHYKGKEDTARYNRECILRWLETDSLSAVSLSLGDRERIVDDNGGDALDSLIAATAAFWASKDLLPKELQLNPLYQLEGYVYL